MKFVIIALKEIKQNLRDKKSMAMMVIYPILLMIILGSALSGAFNDSISFKDTKVLYKIEGKKSISNNFNEFTKALNDLGIETIEIEDEKQAIEKVKDSTYECYIKVDENNKKINVYKNERYNFKSDLIQTILNTYVDRYNTMIEIYKENPKVLPKLTGEKEVNYVNEINVQRNRSPRAIDYYAVTMLTMIVLYAALSGAFAIGGEYIRNTFNRIMCAPIKKVEILGGKVLGNIIVTLLQSVIVVLFSKYVLKAYFGDDMFPIYLVILSEVIMAISMGVGVAFMTKKDTLCSALLNILIPFITFFGGGYVPIGDFKNNTINLISNLSPLKCTNDAIFTFVYSNNIHNIKTAIIINMIIAVVFLSISSLIYKRQVV
ncbi:ABC-2 family transporter protein [Clostridium liquoris]|jgi:ABC-2 type transport system permease protein|uniref:ABC-2 family transporter protein n=1 Tax=Clostridium liquoris TaxID=1289519 RepID=A0A2T0B1N7_9CLOT|nr:SagG family ABC transporter permease subunit [Clostridium liquoris]PRR77724.1 ABC-2 family transporter protein [Clostridium liquoris]